jgi:hypothetical protein
VQRSKEERASLEVSRKEAKVQRSKEKKVLRRINQVNPLIKVQTIAINPTNRNSGNPQSS